MELPAFFQLFGHFRSSSLSSLAEGLRQSAKKRIGDLTIQELCAASEYPNGLYLLFDAEDAPWYVGKATSRSFIERLPAHFDPRENAWFNTVPLRAMKKCQFPTYSAALTFSLDLRVVLLGIQSAQSAKKLEEMLRDHMQPHLNPGKVGRVSGAEQLISYEI